MKNHRPQKIVILGCGNVAWHIARHLSTIKNQTLFVYNHRANKKLDGFKQILKCKTFADFDNIIEDADFYIISVADKFIHSSSKKINTKNPDSVILHTSGTMSIKELGPRVCGTGVMYPLQSFSKQDEIKWAEVPFIIEGNSDWSIRQIQKFASLFSKTIVNLDEKERLKFHLAAVLVNNFTNALYVAASDILGGANSNDNFKIILPLINKTTQKLERLDPRMAQTGPAKRNDELVIKKHLHLLDKQPELKKIYKQLTKLIIKQQSN